MKLESILLKRLLLLFKCKAVVRVPAGRDAAAYSRFAANRMSRQQVSCFLQPFSAHNMHKLYTLRL
jgi:hypothetical protein